MDGYVRRILVNEHNSLWRRAWKRREHTADDSVLHALDKPHHDAARRRRRRRALGRRPDPPTQGPCGRRPPLLRGDERGRDRGRARDLRRHREVPDQPGAGRPAHPCAPDPEPPRKRGGRPMNDHDDLTRTLSRELDDRAHEMDGSLLHLSRRPGQGPLDPAPAYGDRGGRRRRRRGTDRADGGAGDPHEREARAGADHPDRRPRPRPRRTANSPPRGSWTSRTSRPAPRPRWTTSRTARCTSPAEGPPR